MDAAVSCACTSGKESKAPPRVTVSSACPMVVLFGSVARVAMGA